MAKYVIAGKSDCPFFARAELIADEMSLRLPNFAVHKIVLNSEKWDDWVIKICNERDWKYDGRSPIIWRELINRGGKGTLLGSCDDFLEMAKEYYGISCVKDTDTLLSIAHENEEAKIAMDREEKIKLSSKKTFKITVVDADLVSMYNTVPLLFSEEIFKDGAELNLSLHSENEKNLDVLVGLQMELEDCAFSDLTNITSECSLSDALNDSNMVIIPCLSDDIDSKSLEKWKLYGLNMNELVNKTCKVLLMGRNAAQACYIISQHCPLIDRGNFFVLSRLQENRAKAAFAKKLNVLTSGVSNVITWGASPHMITDHSNAIVYGYNGAIWAPHIKEFSHVVNEIIHDNAWLEDELKNLTTNNEASNHSKGYISLASAFITQIQDIMNPNRNGMFSLGLISQGWYGVPEGIAFSFPVVYNNGIIVKDDLELSEDLQLKIKMSAESLQEQCSGYLQSLSSE